MGVGMVAIVSSEAADEVRSGLRARDCDAWVLGEVVAGSGRVQIR